MSTPNRRRGVWTSVLVVGSSWLAAGVVLSQESQPQSPATQPAGEAQSSPAVSRPAETAQERLRRVREEAERRRRDREARIAAQSSPAGEQSRPAPVTSGTPTSNEIVPDAANQPVATQESGEGGQSAPSRPSLRPRTRPSTPPATLPEGSQPAGAPDGNGNGVVRKPSVTPGGATQQAPVERPAVVPTPQDGKTEWFVYKNVAYEDIIPQFVERIGKPLIGPDAMPTGTLTYENPRRMTKQEAIDELNMLMMVNETGYRLVEFPEHVMLIELSEMPKYVEPERIYGSVEEFEAANLRPMEYATVYMKIEGRTAKKIVEDYGGALPIYAYLSADEDSNQVKITAVAQDIRRFLTLFRKVDPLRKERIALPMKIFKTKTNVLEVERMVRELLNVRAPQVRFNPQTRQMEQTGDESAIRIIADSRTNSLIVMAEAAKLELVQNLIDELDIIQDIGKFTTTVIPVKHGNATTIANMLNQVFAQEQGGGVRSVPRPMPARPGQPVQPGQAAPQPIPGQVTPQDVIVEDIYERAKKTVKLFADDRSNSLIVYANEDGLKRVQEMLETIDQPVPSNFKTIKLTTAKVGDIFPTIDAIARGLGSASPLRGGTRATVVTPDEENNALHLVADREVITEVERIIQQLDVKGEEEERHLVELKKFTPSRMAELIRPLLEEGRAAQTSAPRGAPRGRATATANLIPIDETRTLIVVCKREQWEKIRALIEVSDANALSDKPEVRSFTIEHANPDNVLNVIQTLYRQYSHPTLGKQPVVTAADGATIHVQAVAPALDEIASVVKMLDVEPKAYPIVIIPLRFADVSLVATQLQTLLNLSGQPSRGKVPMSLTADPVTNSIVLRADEFTVAQAKDYIQRMESGMEAQATERRFYSLKIATATDAQNAINGLFGMGTGRVGGPTQRQVKVGVAGSQLWVEAPRDKFAEIEQIINQLDNAEGRDIVIKTVKMPGADVNSIAGRLSNAFRSKTEGKGLVARFDADPSTESILLTISTALQAEAEKHLDDYRQFTLELIPQTEFRQLQYANAQEAATWLQQQLVASLASLGRIATSQIKVWPDTRTNKVIISGPAVAVKEGVQLLTQFDAPGADLGIESRVVTDTRKLPGLDVMNLANQLTNIYRARPPRPDKLQFTFGSDVLTSMLILTVPKDAVAEVDQFIAKFAAETEEVAPTEKFFDIVNADAQYVLDQIRNVLVPKISGLRGQNVAARINVAVDTRQNRVIMNAPKFAIEMAERLIAELDRQVEGPALLETIRLMNADAASVVQVLNSVLQEKFRQNRNMKVNVEPISNSLIVSGAGKNDLDQIRTWALDLDKRVLDTQSETKVIPIENATVQEIISALNTRYMQRRAGSKQQQDVFASQIGSNNLLLQAPRERLPEIEQFVATLDGAVTPQENMPVTIELKFVDANTMRDLINAFFGQGRTGPRGAGAQQVQVSTSGSTTLVVRAPAKEMKQIQELIKSLDEQDPASDMDVKTYQLKVLNATEVALLANGYLMSLQTSTKPGSIKPTAVPERATNTLIVIAPKSKMPMIDMLIAKLESVERPESDFKTYVLKNVRSDQVSQQLDTMLKAKVAEREGRERAAAIATAVLADQTGTRLFVTAPPDYQDLAAEMIRIVDAEVEGGEVVHAITLEAADATPLADTINKMLQQPAGGKGAPRQVRVIAEPSSNTLLVQGLPKDVAWVEQQIQDLEGRGASIPELQVFRLQNSDADDLADVLAQLFPKAANPADTVTITADSFYSKLTVVANRRKMRQVEAMVKALDAPRPEGESLLGDKQIYFVDVYRGDAWEIALDVEDLLPSDSPGGPTLDADWYGEYIKVTCRPSDFPEVERLIREYDARARVTYTFVQREFKADPEKLLPLLANRIPNLQIERVETDPKQESMIVDVWEDTEAPPGARPKSIDQELEEERRQHERKEREGRRIGGSRAPRESGVGRAAPAEPNDSVEDLSAGAEHALNFMLAAYAPVDDGTTVPKRDDPARTSPLRPGSRRLFDDRPATSSAPGGDLKREPAKVQVLPGGRVIISGPENAVKDVEKAIDVLVEDMKAGQVIRIFRLKYGDATSAAQVLDRLFNEQQQRQLGMMNPMMQMQQMQQMQQLQQQMAQQQQGRGGQEGGGRGGRGGQGGQGGQAGQGGGGILDQMRQMVGGRAAAQLGNQQQPGGPATATTPLRIAVDSGHNRLIIKCDETDIPKIKELLRYLDIPPSDVDVRVFQLKNIDAQETANNIKEVLGINRAANNRQRQQGQQGGRGAAFPFGGQFGGNPFFEIFNQQLSVQPAGLDDPAKIESVEIVPNVITNSLMVSAPPEVMTIIENTIDELEGLEGRDVLTIEHRVLKNARVEQVVPLLQEIFSSDAAGGGRGRTKASPADLGPVTVSGDPRSNTLVITAQRKDLPVVDAQIKLLDIPGDISELETYVVEFGDAESIAEVLRQSFGGAGDAGGRGGRGGRATGAATSDVRINAEPLTNTILVWGPEDKREQVIAKIRELDQLIPTEVREIALQYADAEKLAGTLTQMVGGRAVTPAAGPGAAPGGRGAGGGRGAAGATSSGRDRVVIIGDKNAKKLLVKAPDTVFDRIVELVGLLDVPGEIMEIARFPLRYAQADAVVASVKQALTEFIQLQRTTGGGDLGFEPPIPMADARTNSVVVVGEAQTLPFIRTLLDSIDVPTPEDQRKIFRMFVLTDGEAQTVADAINALSTTAQAQSGGGGRGAGGRGAVPGGTGVVGLDVQAVAEPSSNAVMVYGKPADIQEVEERVINQYAVAVARRVYAIEVQNISPTELLSNAQLALQDITGNGEASLTPNDNAKTIIGWLTEAEYARVEAIVPQFDRPGIGDAGVDVVDARWSPDVVALAREVERVINAGQQSMSQRTGMEPRLVTIGADPQSKKLLVYGDRSMYPLVQAVVNSLSEGAGQIETRVFQLRNLTSDDAQRLIEDLQARRRGSTGGTGGGTRITPAGGGGAVQPGGANRPTVRPGVQPGGTRGVQPAGGGRGTQPMPGGGTAQPRGGAAQPRGAQPGAAPRGGQQNQGAPRNRPTGGRGGTSLWRSPAQMPAGAIVPDSLDAIPGGVLEPVVATFVLPPSLAPIYALQDATRQVDPNETPDEPQLEVEEMGDGASAAPAQDTPPPAPRQQPPARTTRPAGRPASTPAAPVSRPAGRGASRPARGEPVSISRDVPKDATQDAPAGARPSTREAVRPTIVRPRGAATQGLPRGREQQSDERGQPAGRDGGPTTQVTVESGIRGELRGDVFSTPLDNDKLIIVGDSNDLDFLERMLSLMEVGAPRPELQIFELENANAAAIQPIVEQAMQALIQGRTTRPGRGDQFSIIAESRSNSLIVAASAENLETIGQIIASLDNRDRIDTATQVIVLNHIQAGEAAAFLQPIVEKMNSIKQVPADAAASITPFDRNNSLLVIGTPPDIAEIERLVAQIDVELAEGQGISDFSVAEALIINLKNAVAEDVATTLSDLIAIERTTGGQAGGGQGGARRAGASLIRRLRLLTGDGRTLPDLDLDRPIVISSEQGTNSLIVFTSKKNLEPIKEIVSLFDTLPEGADVEVRAVTLLHASAEDVATMLDELFEQGRESLTRPAEGPGGQPQQGVMPPVPVSPTGRGLPYKVTVTHDTRSNTVYIVGRKDAVVLAASLIAQVDKPTMELALRPHVINLKNVQANTLKDKLTEMLDERATSLGSGERNAARDSAVLMAEERTNSLIVLSTDEVFDMISDVVEQVDLSPSYRVVDLRFRPLKFADSGKLQALMQDLFDKKKETETNITESKDSVSIIADTRSNALLLTGTRDYIEEALKLIDQLDQRFESPIVFKVRPLLFGSAPNIATLLTEMVEKTKTTTGGEQAGGTPIHISADSYSNNLLLGASAEDMGMVERWVELLDNPAQPGRVTKIIPVKRQKAESLADQAENLFSAGAGGGGAAGGGSTDVTVTFDAVTNSVIANGPIAVVKDIEAFLLAMDNVKSDWGAQVKRFKLEQADAESAGELLRNILSLQSGSVGGTGGTGGGTTGQEEAAKQVMLIYQKQNPDMTTQVLKAMRESIVVIDDVRTNSLYVVAPPDGVDLVSSLVTAIDIPPDSVKIRVFELRNSTAEELVQTIEDLFQKSAAGGSTGTTGGTTGTEGERILSLGEGVMGGRQEVTLSVDTRTNSIVAAGTQGYLDIVEDLVMKLDSKPVDDRKTIVYSPRNKPAAAIQQALAEYNDGKQQQLEGIEEGISPSRRLEGEILAVTNEDTNKIIIDYDPRRELEVLDLVRQLDQAPPQVMIQVLILEVTLDNSLELGMEFSYQDLQWTKAGPNDTTTFDYVGGTDIGAAGSGLGGFTFTITGRDFNFLFRTLQNESSLNVLSRPQIIATDGEEAVIDISNDVPYVTGTSTTEGGQVQTSVARERIGIRLTVTPQINDDGYVRLDLDQEVSDITNSTVAVGPGVTAPVFFRRQATTVVNVRDGETVVLGGLITTRDERVETKVPIVGDIPGLGLLFRNDVVDTQRQELLLVLTPRIVRTVEDYRSLSVQERDRTGIVPEEILTHPLMDRLQVEPERIMEHQLEREKERKDRRSPSAPSQPANDGDEEYGPVIGQGGRSTREEDYTVPLPRAARETGVSLNRRP